MTEETVCPLCGTPSFDGEQRHAVACPRHDPETCPGCSDDESGVMRDIARIARYANRFERIAGGSFGPPIIYYPEQPR